MSAPQSSLFPLLVSPECTQYWNELIRPDYVSDSGMAPSHLQKLQAKLPHSTDLVLVFWRTGSADIKKIFFFLVTSLDARAQKVKHAGIFWMASCSLFPLFPIFRSDPLSLPLSESNGGFGPPI